MEKTMSQSRIKELVAMIIEAKEAYYNETPIYSDAEFDSFEDELRSLDPNNAELKKVGAKPQMQVTAWPVVNHERPMGSLNKVNSEDDLRKWAEKYVDDLICSSEKLDGMSIELIYQDGKVVSGITRGDGEKGEDITPNVKTFKGVQEKIPMKGRIAVRGEALLFLADYQKYFPRTELADGTVENANPRNCVAMIRSKHDSDRCKHVTFVAFDYVVIDGNEDRPSTKEEVFVNLKNAGFRTPNYKVGKIDKILAWFKEYENGLREQLPYEIDGMVDEADNLAYQASQGESSGRPRAARAHKFGSQKGESVVHDCEFQSGRTAVVTPVGKIDPVVIGGITIRSPSLMNLAEICRLGVGIGSKVTVERANDVIPRIIKATGGTPIPLPYDDQGTYFIKVRFNKEEQVEKVLDKKVTVCYKDIAKFLGVPESKLIEASSIFLMTSANDDTRIVKKLDNFLKTLDVKGVGEKSLIELVVTKKAVTIQQMLALTEADWSAATSGDKIAQKIAYDINQKLQGVTLPKFIKALGLDFFGEDTTERLVEAGFDTVEKILAIKSRDTMLAIPGIKDAKADAAMKAIKEQASFIREVAAKVRFKAAKAVVVTGNHPLSGKKVCFTGVRLKGDQVSRFESLGMEEVSGVSKNTDILVCKDPSSSSSKMEKAKELGIQVISLDDFVSRL
jgi:DNA ligase (NAD+)